MKRETVLLILIATTGMNWSIVSCTASPTVDRSNPISQTQASSVAQVQANLPDLLILPGERVGSITATTTFQDLVDQFGVDRVTNKSFHIGEGEMAPATRVDLGEARSFTVLWQDETRTEAVAVAELGADWKTPEGIGMGTTLSELTDELGEFELYGFGWDYSGTVILEGTELAKYNGTLILRLSPEQDRVENQMEDYEAVLGDASFASTNPHMQALNPTVTQMIVRLIPPQ